MTHKSERICTIMHDWNHDGKIDMRDRIIQDEIESRNSGSGSGGPSTGGGSGGSCIIILLIPIIILFIYAVGTNAPSGVFSIIFFIFAVVMLFGSIL